MAQHGDLLERLTVAITTRDPAEPLSSRLCEAYRDLAGADGAAITVHYESAARVTLCTTDRIADRLEDLQDVVGEGPGHSASASGQIEVCTVPTPASPRWSLFVDAAQDIVESALIHAVPMHPEHEVFGVITLYQSPQPRHALGLQRHELQFLANVIGAALIREVPGDEASEGPWASRARVHQATGIVVAQMKVGSEDALALLRAHAYGQQRTLSEVASAVVERRIVFPIQ